MEMTLIVAATRNMGIGRAGALPWTGLKKEMAYFARVTKRLTTVSSDEDALHPRLNAVIMGRKTWESIPTHFRPLKGRLNIVLSHTFPSDTSENEEPVKLSSFSAVKKALSAGKNISRCFVIGGAEIYGAALAENEAKRILLTRVLTDFECDTWFPATLSEEENSEWEKKSEEDLDRWVGEEVPKGVQEENGIKYIFEMYEKH